MSTFTGVVYYEDGKEIKKIKIPSEVENYDLKRIGELIQRIRLCTSVANNCDYLLEHSDCDDLIAYIDTLEETIGGLSLEKQKLEYKINKFVERLEDFTKDMENNWAIELSDRVMEVLTDKKNDIINIIDK